jgi:hypothetical protein
MTYAFSGIVVRYCAKTAQENIETPAPSIRVSDADQLHVNLWEIEGQTVIDLGIMITAWQNIDALQVDLPWVASVTDITDLGARLNSEKTIAAIFNEIVHYDGSADLNYADISFRPSEQVGFNASNDRNYGHFRLLRLSSKAYSVSRLYPHASSQVRVTLPSDFGDTERPKRLYVRFRITNVPSDLYSDNFRQKDRNLLSSSQETRVIDFRINVRRGVPDEILNGDGTVWYPRFGKIHFFLTIDREQICDFESNNFIGCRSLFDEEIWNEYISPTGARRSISVNRYLGYQWSATGKITTENGSGAKIFEPVKDLVILGRFSRHHASPAGIIVFILLGLMFGLLGNAIWDVFQPSANYFDNLRKRSDDILVIAAVLAAALVIVFVPVENIISGWTAERRKRRAAARFRNRNDG